MTDEIKEIKPVEITCPVCGSEFASDGKAIYRKGKRWRDLETALEISEKKSLEIKPEDKPIPKKRHRKPKKSSGLTFFDDDEDDEDEEDEEDDNRD